MRIDATVEQIGRIRLMVERMHADRLVAMLAERERLSSGR
jgi:hypothetical protein